MFILRIILIPLMISLTSCRGADDSKSSLRTVRYQKVHTSSGVRLRAFSGLTRSGVESKLSFRVPGAINKLAVKVGDKVKKGDIIAKVDPTDFDLQFQETEASLLQSKAQDRHAAAKYARIRELYETRSTSRNELDAARAESESASAAVEAMQKKLALTRSQVSYTMLRAPEDGSIAEVNAEINENIKTGQPIVILNSGFTLDVKVSIPEILIAQIQRGDQVTASFGALPGKYFKGYVSEVGVSSQIGTTFPVTVELPKAPEGIRSGMAAEVVFEFLDPEQRFAIYVPSRAIEGQGKSRYVYILNPETDGTGIVEKREVAVGELTNSGLEITSGVADGEFLITAGIHFLTDGQRVRMVSEKEVN